MDKDMLPPLFAFIRPFASCAGLVAWIPGAASCHCERTHSRNKAIIRTHHRQEIAVVLGSDYMGLVRSTGLELAKACFNAF